MRGPGARRRPSELTPGRALGLDRAATAGAFGVTVKAMRPGRNDPCPCGSGRKYKACCLPREREAGPRAVATPAARLVARAIGGWEADLLSVPVEIRSEPDARPAVPLVVAGGAVLDAQVTSRPGSEIDEVAGEIARAVERAAERIGGYPAELRVRHAELVAPLRRRLAGPGVRILARRSSAGFQAAARALLAEVAGRPGLGRVTLVRAWRGWGQPEEWNARLHRAAAALYRASPWRALTNVDLLHLETRSGRRWIAGVLGNDQQEFGLVLYSELAEFLRLSVGDGFDEAGMRGRYLSLSFDSAGEVAREQRREQARTGWEVASPEAYPLLIVANSVGGGLCGADAEDLVAALEAVPRYLEAEVPEGEAFLDAPTGLAIEEHRHEEARGLPPRLAPPLAPGFVKGERAHPEARLAALERAAEDPDGFADAEGEVIERFARALEEERLGRAAIAAHAGRASTFVDFLARFQGVPLAALHELDLRTFLHDWYPRNVVTSDADARATPGTLGRFFGYLSEREGLDCPWAAAILADRKSYAARRKSFPGGFFWNVEVADWIAELTPDLDARALLPDSSLAGGEDWGSTMGPIEARLHDELRRRWLLWREELLSRSPPPRLGRLRAALVTRQREWERAPHPGLGGASPLEAIQGERDRQPEPPPPADFFTPR